MSDEIVREGKCIDCGAHVVVYADGSRSACDCQMGRMDTEQDKAFERWIEDQKKGEKR